MSAQSEAALRPAKVSSVSKDALRANNVEQGVRDFILMGLRIRFELMGTKNWEIGATVL